MSPTFTSWSRIKSTGSPYNAVFEVILSCNFSFITVPSLSNTVRLDAGVCPVAWVSHSPNTFRQSKHGKKRHDKLPSNRLSSEFHS